VNGDGVNGDRVADRRAPDRRAPDRRSGDRRRVVVQEERVSPNLGTLLQDPAFDDLDRVDLERLQRVGLDAGELRGRDGDAAS
jgi:hypothetical protein